MSAKNKDVESSDELDENQCGICAVVGCVGKATHTLRNTTSDTYIRPIAGSVALAPQVCETHFSKAGHPAIRQQDAAEWVALQDSDEHSPGHCEVCGEQREKVREVSGTGFVVSICMQCELFGEDVSNHD